MGYHDLPPLNDLSPTNAPAMLSIMSWQELEKLPFLVSDTSQSGSVLTQSSVQS